MTLTRRSAIAAGLAAFGTRAAGAGYGLPGGFFVPAEEAPHELTFMQWPVSRKVFPDPAFLDMTQTAIARVANTIADFEPVIMLADAGDHPGARKRLSDAVTLWNVPTEDLWCRDAGPLVAIGPNGQRAVSNLNFNGWGGRQGHARDGRIAATVARRLGLPGHDSGLRGEAGGVEQDGHGLLIAHESSWVNTNRNPGLTRDQIGARLMAAYGAERIVWAPGITGMDITDYHIDSLARFHAPGKLLIQLPAHISHHNPFHVATMESYEHLRAAGLDLSVIAEPFHPRIQHPEFVASYVNYYVCNGAVIAAEFGEPDSNSEAAATLRAAYPDREIVQLNVDPLGELGGGIHCATQQLPAV